MKDYAVVYFNGLERGFSVPSTLCEFSIGGLDFSIRFYGVLIALGYLLALILCTRLAKKKGMDIDALYDSIIYGTIGAIIGARAYYVLFNLSYYAQDPSRIFKITEGGLAIYGGIIGAFLTVVLVCKIRKQKILDVLDLAAVGFLLGQGVGRWGNFMNQEAFGTNTDLPWGMTSDKISLYIIENQDFFAEKGIVMDPYKGVHPTFLYESIWCILGFVLLYVMFSHYRKFAGQILLSYGVWYGFERTIVEGFRTDSLYIGQTDIRVSQVLSAIVVIACAGLLVAGFIKTKKEIIKEEVPENEQEAKES